MLSKNDENKQATFQVVFNELQTQRSMCTIQTPQQLDICGKLPGIFTLHDVREHAQLKPFLQWLGRSLEMRLFQKLFHWTTHRRIFGSLDYAQP